MFDHLTRELKRLEHGISIPVSLPVDEDGYFDRQCPAERCKADFKILEQDWKDKVAVERVFCPICRHEAPADEWNTEAQLDYAKQSAVHQFERVIHRALQTGARRFNQRQRPGFITLSLSVSPFRNSVFLPTAVGEVMRQRFTCEVCACRYTSIGAAFFCPACGHNSALSTFEQTLVQVRNTIEAIPKVREALTHDRDGSENTIRLMLEQCLTRLVGGFERFTQALFAKVPTPPVSKISRGTFQRLDDASILWQQAIGRGYDAMLSQAEYRELKVLVQKRHLFVHCEGIVDLDYLQKSADNTYTVGQRVVVQDHDILKLITLLDTITRELKAAIP